MITTNYRGILFPGELLDEWGYVTGERTRERTLSAGCGKKRPGRDVGVVRAGCGKMVGRRAAGTGDTRRLKIKDEFGIDAQPVKAHLDGIEGAAGLAVIGGFIPVIRYDGQVGVNVENIIYTAIPDHVLGHFIGEIDVRGYFSMMDEIFRYDRLSVVRLHIGVPAKALVGDTCPAGSAGCCAGKTGIAETLRNDLAEIGEVGADGEFLQAIFEGQRAFGAGRRSFQEILFAGAEKGLLIGVGGVENRRDIDLVDVAILDIAGECRLEPAVASQSLVVVQDDIHAGVRRVDGIGEEVDRADVVLDQVRRYCRDRPVKAARDHYAVLHLYPVSVYSGSQIMRDQPAEAKAAVDRCLLGQFGDARRTGDGAIIRHQFDVYQLTGDDIGVGVTKVHLLQRRRAEAGAEGAAKIKIVGELVTAGQFVGIDKSKVGIVLETGCCVDQPRMGDVQREIDITADVGAMGYRCIGGLVTGIAFSAGGRRLDGIALSVAAQVREELGRRIVPIGIRFAGI